MTKPEINSGSLVRFEEKDDDPIIQENLDALNRIYPGRQFRVCQRLPEHVTLYEDEQNDKLLHIGSTQAAWIHIGLVQISRS